MIAEYKTQNVAIAAMLFTLGVKWSKNDDGREVPCVCQYDYDMLCKLATKQLPELQDMDIVEGAKLAHRRGYKGHVDYMFERSPLFDRLIASWNKHEEWMKAQDQISNGEGTAKMDFADIEPESAARLFCQWAKNRNMISNLWRGAMPDVVVVGESKTESEPVTGPKGETGERTIRTGSVKIMSVNASPKTRERMRI